MNGFETVNFTKQLKDTIVLDAATASEVGVVTDLLLDPCQGTALALLFQPPAGKEQALLPENFLVHEDSLAVIAYGETVTDVAESASLLKDGVKAYGELIGSDIVARDGRLLGRIDDVFLRLGPLQAIYHFTSSFRQRLFGGGSYLVGNAPGQYSRIGTRLIVPSDTENFYVFGSLGESVEAWRQETVAA
ncbi:MAG TPA: hypothetical protein VJ302_19720 [Blastocatellia bacterium]|nr:hypothetical protein [Blastocatellia bacterium]